MGGHGRPRHFRAMYSGLAITSSTAARTRLARPVALPVAMRVERGLQRGQGRRADLAGRELQVQRGEQRRRVGRERQPRGLVGLQPADAVADAALHEVEVAGDRRLGRDLELRRGPRAEAAGRRHVAGPEVVEDRGRVQRALAELCGRVAQVADAPLPGRVGQAEGARPLDEAQHRLAQLAGGRVGQRGGVGARLGVEQHRAHHRPQVALDAGAVVVEGRRHARHVGRAGLARDQALDQLAADEGAHVGVRDERIERQPQARQAVGAGRDHAAEKALLAGLVARRDLHHRRDHPAGVVDGADRGVGLPAGEDAGELADVGLAVALERDAVGAEARAAVGCELHQPDREQLHQLARVVLVGQAAGRRVGLAAALVREVAAHRDAGRDLLEQRAVRAEGVGLQDVEEGGRRELAERGAGDVGDRHHDQLRQRQRHPLAQRVGPADQLAPHHRIGAGRVVLVGDRVQALAAQPFDVRRAARQRHLLVEPAGIAERLHPGDIGRRAGERGLRQEARRLLAGGRRGRRHRHAGVAAATAAAAGRQRRERGRRRHGAAGGADPIDGCGLRLGVGECWLGDRHGGQVLVARRPARSRGSDATATSLHYPCAVPRAALRQPVRLCCATAGCHAARAGDGD